MQATMNAMPFTLWLEFEHWEAEPDDDPEDEFCNVRIDLLNGRYLTGPDLLVTRLDRATMEEVFLNSVQAAQLKREWRVPLGAE